MTEQNRAKPEQTTHTKPADNQAQRDRQGQQKTPGTGSSQSQPGTKQTQPEMKQSKPQSDQRQSTHADTNDDKGDTAQQ